jgi:hypothetical protein
MRVNYQIRVLTSSKEAMGDWIKDKKKPASGHGGWQVFPI